MKKVCTKCSVEKPLSEFHRDNHTRDGVNCACKQCYNTHKREMYQKNPSKYVEAAKRWQIEHPQRNAIIQRRYVRKRLAKDPVFKLSAALRARIVSAFKSRGVRKGGKAFDLLGCTPVELQTWLASKFQPGMTLGNHGQVWDIDHIIPCSAWDLTNPEHVRACFHYTNLQPLAKAENRWIKGGANRYPLGHFDAAIAERLIALRTLEG